MCECHAGEVQKSYTPRDERKGMCSHPKYFFLPKLSME
jgi:hypothetical protein